MKTHYQWPSVLSLAGNKREIEIERNTEFPARAKNRYANAAGRVRGNLQEKAKENVDEIREGLYVDVDELPVSGRKEKRPIRESRAICAGECQSTMGQMREGIGTKTQVEPSKIYKKNRIFGTLELDRTDVGNPAREGVLPSYLTPSSRHLGRCVTHSGMTLAPLVH